MGSPALPVARWHIKNRDPLPETISRMDPHCSQSECRNTLGCGDEDEAMHDIRRGCKPIGCRIPATTPGSPPFSKRVRTTSLDPSQAVALLPPSQPTHLADLEFSQVEEHNRPTQVSGQWVGRAAGDQAHWGRGVSDPPAERLTSLHRGLWNAAFWLVELRAGLSVVRISGHRGRGPSARALPRSAECGGPSVGPLPSLPQSLGIDSRSLPGCSRAGCRRSDHER